jgi:hypothetical protein
MPTRRRSNVVHVPDVPGPKGLCWKQNTRTMERCTFKARHKGRHQWARKPARRAGRRGLTVNLRAIDRAACERITRAIAPAIVDAIRVPPPAPLPPLAAAAAAVRVSGARLTAAEAAHSAAIRAEADARANLDDARQWHHEAKVALLAAAEVGAS